MPSIAQSSAAGQKRLESGQLVYIPQGQTPPPGVSPPTAAFPAAPNQYLRAPLPSGMWQDPDAQRQFHAPAIPQVRLAPLPDNTSPVAGAQAATQSIQVVQSGLSTLLETNNTPNAKQNILNLIAGSNVTLSADAQGGVTIGGTGGGTSDGLDHGTTPFWTDPGFVGLRDDFLGGSTATPGELGWDIQSNLAGTNGPVRGSVGGFPMSGAYQMSNSGSVNGYTVGFLDVTNSGDADKWPIFDYPGWKLTFVFGFGLPVINTAPGFTKKSLYVGLASSWQTDNSRGFGVRPNTFMGVRYDTDTTAPSIGDTTFNFEVVANVTNQTTLVSRNNTQGTTFNTGVAPAVGTMYRLDIQMVAAGKITMSLNGSTPQTFNVPTQVAGGAGSSSSFAITSSTAWVEITSTVGQTQTTVFAPGSLPTISGFTGAGAPLNGVHLLQQSEPQSGTTPVMGYQVVSGNVAFGAGDANVSATGFPAVVPIFTFGNDSQAAPTADQVRFMIDYFGFVWNPGVAGLTTTPDPTKPRYF